MRRLRGFLLALLALGLCGTGTELLLLGHDEDPWQWIPLVLIALAVVVVGLQAWRGSAAVIRLLRVVMGLMIAAGVLGVVLHYRGNLAFQVDMDPTASGWELFKKVVRAKAPPALAPGAMAQLGLLGLIYSYRHPSLQRDGR